MTQIESNLPPTSPLRINAILAELKPEVNQEFFTWLDGVIRSNVSNSDEQVRVLDELKKMFPEEVRGRISASRIREAQKEQIRQYPNDRNLEEEIVKAPSYVVEAIDKKIAQDNLGSVFAIGLAQNPTYKVEDQDKQYVWNHTKTNFAFYLTQNPNYLVTEEDKKVARDFYNLNSYFTQGLLRNPSYVVDETDKAVARKNPDSQFAKLIIERLAA